MKLKILLLEDIPTIADTIEVRVHITILSESFNAEKIHISKKAKNSKALLKSKTPNGMEMDAVISLSKIKGGYIFAPFQKTVAASKGKEKALIPNREIEGMLAQKGTISAELELKNKEIRVLRSEVEKAKLQNLLSKRELEILSLLATGQSIKEIAKQLFLSPATIATYRARLLEKLNLKSNIDIVLYAIRSGLIE